MLGVRLQSTDSLLGQTNPEPVRVKGLRRLPPLFALRLYSPQQPWFDKTWRPGEIELVK
ncbi:MAG: hypothetical protein WBD61_09640 [Desulfobulbales bacterium]